MEWYKWSPLLDNLLTQYIHELEIPRKCHNSLRSYRISLSENLIGNNFQRRKSKITRTHIFIKIYTFSELSDKTLQLLSKLHVVWDKRIPPLLSYDALFLRPAVSIVIVANNGHLPPLPPTPALLHLASNRVSRTQQKHGQNKALSCYNTTGCHSFQNPQYKSGPDSGPLRARLEELPHLQPGDRHCLIGTGPFCKKIF